MDRGTLVFAVTILGILAAIAFFGAVEKRKVREGIFYKLKKNFGKIPEKGLPEERYALIPRYFEKHRASEQIDDITWNDLSMDTVFRRIDQTQSAAGEEYLYYALRTPDMAAGRSALNKDIIAYFEASENEETRLQLQQELAGLGHSGKYSLYDFLEILEHVGKRNTWQHIIFALLPFAAIGLMFISSQFLFFFLLTIAANFMTYFREKKVIEPFVVCFRYIGRLLRTADKISAVKCDELSDEQNRLRKDLQKMKGFQRGSWIVLQDSSSGVSGNPADIILDYIRIFFHLDLIKFDSMLDAVRKHMEEVDEMVTIVGKIDAEISAASYRRSLEHGYCLPELKENAREYMARGLYHPMLSDPVRNSITADRSVLLTGSNASGKSTFLKSAALCALLGQTIHTCCAEEYRGAYYRIFSSMALRDDIQSGESYFIVEIKSIKRILDAAAEEGAPVLCFIDEVLRGTNTVERIAASAEILSGLPEEHVLCFAATHDIELTELLDNRYDNYHFQEEIREEDVVFNYCLYPGKATGRNAIRLLHMMGYAPDIVENAEKRAQHFLSEGTWS